ncbi:MAG: hypothetical protein QNK80_06165 [Akkermansiaceae bacterium]|jgi:hypothetical protein|tara:strand:+ start:343 stop:978 length:636 start_codon:yes stop_codon:yes gene_type:complete
MKLKTLLLLSSALLIFTSCKSEETPATPDEPSNKTETQTATKEDAPVEPKPVAPVPVAPVPVVSAPVVKPAEPAPAPKPAPVITPKKMTIEELAANIAKDPKAVAKKVADLQGAIAGLMESVVDTETAELALFELDPIFDDMKVLGEAMASANKDLDPELTADLQKIAAAPQARLQAAMMQAAPVFMADPKLRTKLQGTMQKLMQARKVGQ